MDGTVASFVWNKLLASCKVSPYRKLAFRCAFERSDLLYGDNWTTIFHDKEVRKLITKKFVSLSENGPVVAEWYGSSCIKRQDNPFPFPHADSTIYKNTLYVASPSGVHRTKCQRNKGNPINKNAEKCWDCATLSIRANYGSLALAAGSEGLFELPVNTYAESRANPECIERRNCIEVNWTYFSIYGSSHLESGFFTAYENVRDEYNVDPTRSERRKLKTIDALDLFKNSGYSWGYLNRLCMAREGGVQTLNYDVYCKDEDPIAAITDLGFTNVNLDYGSVISGAISAFGVIIECEKAIIVVPSDGSDAIPIVGEIISWRIFPRSKYYQNQIHIVFDDRLEVVSFNHDYFVDQSAKPLGTKPSFMECMR